MSALPANDNQRIPVTCMSLECALWLGAKPVPYDKAGRALPLVPPRPTLIIHGHKWADSTAIFMYWELVPELERRPDDKDEATHS